MEAFGGLFLFQSCLPPAIMPAFPYLRYLGRQSVELTDTRNSKFTYEHIPKQLVILNNALLVRSAG